jgi:HK97 gp10 family phage protein
VATLKQHNRNATYSLKITGDKKLDRALRKLEPKVAKKVLRKALRESLRPVKRKVEQLAPRGPTGQTHRNVKILAATRTRKKVVRIRVVIGRGYFVGEQFYASFAELGTKRSGLGIRRGIVSRITGRRTKNVGQRAQHFMRRAYESTAPEARRIAIDEIRRGVEREARG